MSQHIRHALEAIAGPLTPFSPPSTAAGNAGWSMTFCPRADFLGFDGHFPDHPVLPAVVQLLMAEIVIARALGRPVSTLSVSHAKFSLPVTPGTELRCCVTPSAPVAAEGTGVWQCRIVAQDAVVASFRWQGA